VHCGCSYRGLVIIVQVAWYPEQKDVVILAIASVLCLQNFFWITESTQVCALVITVRGESPIAVLFVFWVALPGEVMKFAVCAMNWSAVRAVVLDVV
jgi:hypothetical protein